MLYNVYCDETCHLEHDGINDMVLGAVWCSQEKLKEINQRLRAIKIRNGISPSAELKWTKISPSKVDVYKDIVDYFFDDDDLRFRAVIIPNKGKLNHSAFHQTIFCWRKNAIWLFLKREMGSIYLLRLFISIMIILFVHNWHIMSNIGRNSWIGRLKILC